jgi:hypothetical protein
MVKRIFIYVPILIIIIFLIYLSINFVSKGNKEKAEPVFSMQSLNEKTNSPEHKVLDNSFVKNENRALDELVIKNRKLKKSDYDVLDYAFVERIQQIKNHNVSETILNLYILNKKTTINRDQKQLELKELSKNISIFSEDDTKDLWSFLSEEVRNENFLFVKDFKTIFLMQNNSSKLEEFYSQNIPSIVFENKNGPRTEFFMDGVSMIFQNKENNENDEVLKNILLKVKSNAKLYYRVVHIFKENNPSKTDKEIQDMIKDENRNFPQPENELKSDGPMKIK